MKSLKGMIGQTLPNGLAEIKALTQWGNGDGIVLAFSLHKNEWVTWEFYRNDLSTTSHGHYMRTLAEATTDYFERVDRMYDRFNRTTGEVI